MKNAGKAGSVAKKEVSVSTAATGTGKTKTGKNGVDAPPFAHRTPNQLHASTYVLRRG